MSGGELGWVGTQWRLRQGGPVVALGVVSQRVGLLVWVPGVLQVVETPPAQLGVPRPVFRVLSFLDASLTKRHPGSGRGCPCVGVKEWTLCPTIVIDGVLE